MAREVGHSARRPSICVDVQAAFRYRPSGGSQARPEGSAVRPTGPAGPREDLQEERATGTEQHERLSVAWQANESALASGTSTKR